MPAQISDLLTQATVSTRPTPTTVSSIRAAAGGTLQCLALTGWPTGTAVHFVTYKINTSGAKVAGSQIDMKGVVSGTTITNVTIKAGSDVGNAIGDIVECAPTAAYANDLYTWGSAHANQDGSLIGSAVRTALNQTAATGAGWTTLGYTINTVTANGNRSYDLVVNGSDTTGVTSVGQRLLLPRTVTAPTYMGGAFNGSSHYFTKTTPSGTLGTVTNNFTLMAHVELTSYPSGAGTIAGRSDAANNNSMALDVTSSGQVRLVITSGGVANARNIATYQSLPLNKKVHVAASWTSGTVAIYFDGVSVPVQAAVTSGTAPTTAGTGGDFSIGKNGAFGNYLPGYVSSAGAFDAVLSQATIRLHMNQALTGSETNCIGAWNLNNAATDASSAANNLTATGGVGYTVRSPFTNPVTGTSVTAGTTNYGIIMAQTFSTNTTYTIQIPEGETLPTTGGIGTVSYSTQKTPYGFPGQTGKWRVSMIIGSIISTSGTATNTTYNPGGTYLTVPVGEWRLLAQIFGRTTSNASGLDLYVGISSSSSVFETESGFADRFYIRQADNGNAQILPCKVNRQISVTTATPYYILIRSGQSTIGLEIRGSLSSTVPETTVIDAENAYL